MKLKTKNILPFINSDELDQHIENARSSKQELLHKTGAGSEFLGWLDLPEESFADLPGISEVADEIRSENAALICIGIGGSYLGAKAVIEALAPDTDVFFIGHHLHPDELHHLLVKLKNRSVYVNVISKSGTTTEPGICFRIVKDWLGRNHGSDTEKRIIATTDAREGALRTLADEQGYRTFVIPDDVGGRFSMFTPVGMLPIMCAGIDGEELLQGAKQAMSDFHESDKDLFVLQYAAIRNLLYQKGYKVEILASWHPALCMFTEWWKQLFGESEGKDGRGIFPVSTVFTTDLHSLGQYIQDGERFLFETHLLIDKAQHRFSIASDRKNLDGLNYLTGMKLNDVNEKAWKGTTMAHRKGGVPNLTIRLPVLNAFYLGYLIYFFEFSVALSGYMLGVNPFDQPGVEAYKKAMFKLLGKPGT